MLRGFGRGVLAGAAPAQEAQHDMAGAVMEFAVKIIAVTSGGILVWLLFGAVTLNRELTRIADALDRAFPKENTDVPHKPHR